MEVERTLKPIDHYIKSNIDCLIGGQIALIKKGKREKIDWSIISKFIKKHS